MPINKKDYPENWDEISRTVKERQGWKCLKCGKSHRGISDRGTMIILTTHHKDGDKQNNEDYNLEALCQSCHLSLDLKLHVENARKTRLQKAGKRLLPGL